MKACDGVDELRSDADCVAGATHAAFEDGPDVEPVGDRAKVNVLSLEGESRRPGCDLQPVNLSQGIEELFSKSLGEVLLLLVPAHVDERQYRNRVRRGVEGSHSRCRRASF